MNGHRFQIEYGASALADLDGLPARERAQVLRKIERLQLGLHGDIKRLHEAEAMYRLRMGDSFIREILLEGKVLYESSPRRVDRQGGGRFRRHATRIPGPLKTQLRRRMLSRPAMRREVP